MRDIAKQLTLEINRLHDGINTLIAEKKNSQVQ
jgi:hypothetical protein